MRQLDTLRSFRPQPTFLIQRLLAPFQFRCNLLIFAVVVDLWIPARSDLSASVRLRSLPHAVTLSPHHCADDES